MNRTRIWFANVGSGIHRIKKKIYVKPTEKLHQDLNTWWFSNIKVNSSRMWLRSNLNTCSSIDLSNAEWVSVTWTHLPSSCTYNTSKDTLNCQSLTVWCGMPACSVTIWNRTDRWADNPDFCLESSQGFSSSVTPTDPHFLLPQYSIKFARVGVLTVSKLFHTWAT